MGQSPIARSIHQDSMLARMVVARVRKVSPDPRILVAQGAFSAARALTIGLPADTAARPDIIPTSTVLTQKGLRAIAIWGSFNARSPSVGWRAGRGSGRGSDLGSGRA